jgi:tRNA(Arg) A34 adenosine deaminase TadA
VVRVTSVEDGLELALNVARLSNHNTRVGCVITDRHNHVLSIATNQYKTHPIQYRYAARAGEPKKIYLHAEISGIIKAGEGARKIYIARVGERGLPRFAAPCPICQLAIEEAGIKEIYHT